MTGLPAKDTFFVATKGNNLKKIKFLGSLLPFTGSLWRNADNTEYNPEITGFMGWDVGRGVWGYKAFWVWATGMGTTD